MCHYYHAGATRLHCGERGSQRIYSIGVEVLRWLINEMDGRGAQQRAREQEATPLATGHREPAGAQFGTQTVRLRAKPRAEPHRLKRLPRLRLRHVSACNAQVFEHGRTKDVGILRCDSDERTKSVDANGRAGNRDRTRCGRKGARNGEEERRLADARAPHDAKRTTWLDHGRHGNGGHHSRPRRLDAIEVENGRRWSSGAVCVAIGGTCGKRRGAGIAV